QLSWWMMILSFSLFFCQAEDGIRDLYVTGVQTCALPIFGHQVGLLVPVGDVTVQKVQRSLQVIRRDRRDRGGAGRRRVIAGGRRSEERRVGKEWRSWSSPGR